MSTENGKSENKRPLLLHFDDLKGVPPTFFIGIGGSGGRVVDVLAQRLRSEPTWSRFSELIHFVCVDTDRNDLARIARRVEPSHIGMEHKQRRIQLLRGELDHDEDARTTSWIHPWYQFRSGAGSAGAGQIRLESRFSLFSQIADGLPNNIRDIISRRLRASLNPLNANVARGANVRFFLYGSLAGGTGSGANLTMAYLVRKLAEDAGATAEVYGTFFLPSVFRDYVQQELHSKINANAYAALKELEHCMELRYGVGPKKIELVYDPRRTRSKELCADDYVAREPFDWVYLIDRPEKITVEQVYQAAGEAAYLQLFSPILAFQEREKDNFEQLQSEPSDGFYAVQYGSMGASVLELPRERLIRYFARRKTVELVERLIVGRPSVTDGELAEIDVSSKEFRGLSESEQNRRLDHSFRLFVEQEARAEEEANRKGIFTDIVQLKCGNANLLTELRARLSHELEALEAQIEIQTINAPAITPESPNLNNARSTLSRDQKRAKKDVDRNAALLSRQIQSGQLLAKFFKDYGVTPLQQRYLLIKIDELGRNEELRTGVKEEDEALLDWCFVPSEDLEASAHLATKAPDPAEYDADHPEVRRRISNLEERLQAAGKVRIGREKAFTEARTVAVKDFQRLEETSYNALVVDFWHQINRALQQQLEKRLNLFRVIAKKGMNMVDHLRAQAERCRQNGDVVPPVGQTDMESPAFHLGNEVFFDARANVRQWHLVYKLRVEPGLVVDTGPLLAKVNDVLDRASSGKADATEADSVVESLIAAVDEEVLSKVRTLVDDEDPLTLADGLLLEARLARLGSTGDLTLTDVEGVSDEEAVPHLKDKLERVANMSRPLARFDEAVLASAKKNPYRPRFYGIDPKVLGNSPLLSRVLGTAVDSFDKMEDWSSPDVLSFYQATLGIPLYTYVDVETDLERCYDYEVSGSGRAHPLHTDHRWESEGFRGAQGPGLPNLTLAARRAWEQRAAALRRAAEQARARAVSGHARALAQSFAAGLVVRDVTGDVAIRFRGRTIPLGNGFSAALDAFARMDADIREPVLAEVQKTIDQQPDLFDTAKHALDALRFDAAADGHRPEAEALALLVAQLA